MSHIRAGSINKLTEPSIQAQQCALKYPILRDQILQDSPWQFGRSIKALALLSDETIFNWAYVYQYPSDCLYINRLILNYEEVSPGGNSLDVASRYYDPGLPKFNTRNQVRHQVQLLNNNKVLVANERNIRVDYRARVTDPNLFSINFIMGLSHLLASELAVPIIGIDKGRGIRADELKIYQTYIQSGIANELNEQFDQVPDSEFISVRA